VSGTVCGVCSVGTMRVLSASMSISHLHTVHFFPPKFVGLHAHFSVCAFFTFHAHFSTLHAHFFGVDAQTNTVQARRLAGYSTFWRRVAVFPPSRDNVVDGVAVVAPDRSGCLRGRAQTLRSTPPYLLRHPSPRFGPKNGRAHRKEKKGGLGKKWASIPQKKKTEV